MQILNVEKKYDGKKVCEYLLYKYPFLKQNTLYKALRKKDIRINDIKINTNETIHTGDELKIFITDEFLFSSNNSLNIIFEDDNILVVNKPVRH
jgi:23S rRNA pseudouridine955/2504/2580 synthase